jgi:general secretion pathway protein A
MTDNGELKREGTTSMCTRWVVWIVSVLCVGTLCASLSPAVAESESAVRETGRLLAVLLDAGRVAIGRNQLLLNDPAKGDKGFTPEVFAQQTMGLFKERTGHDLTNLSAAAVPEMARPLLVRLLEESQKTVASYQTVINMPGIKYKGLIPATFGTETGARFQSWSGVYLKQTAPEHLVRNPKNKPDAFEAAEMKKMGEPSFPRVGEQVVSQTVEDGKSMRVLLPLFYGKACLSCHGAPKGERDVTGYPREGAQEGDLGGAISVKLPMP